MNKAYISFLSINVAFKCYVKLSYHTQIKFCNFLLYFTLQMLVSVLILTLTRYIVITCHYIISDIFVKKCGCVQYVGFVFFRLAWKRYINKMGCHLFLRIDNRCAISCFIIEIFAVGDHTALFETHLCNVILMVQML